MRSAVVLLLVGAASLVAAAAVTVPRPSHAECREQFAQWKSAHAKSYASEEDELHRLWVFCHNLHTIRTSNAQPENKFTLALNAFADLSKEEFAAARKMPARKPVHHPPQRYARGLDVRALPAAFDWADASPAVVTPVRDQGSVGSCWAFSTAQNIEGQWALAHKTPAVELSVEQIVDCDNGTSSVNINEDCGVFGGWPYLSYQWVKSVGGLETEEEYPYCCGTGACFPCYAPGTNVQNCGPPAPSCNISQNQCGAFPHIAASISDWTAIATDEQQIAAQLVSRGPLSVLLDATWLDFYQTGIFNPGKWCSTTALDHAVLITGYGTENGTEYWVVKNSWGTAWGMKGYFWIIRGTGECGINTAVTSAII